MKQGKRRKKLQLMRGGWQPVGQWNARKWSMGTSRETSVGSGGGNVPNESRQSCSDSHAKIFHGL